jgi:hypothetical protein
MLLNESLWLGKHTNKLFNEKDVLLNIGSSTGEYRENIQPHIDTNIFTQFKNKGVKIYHVDIKKDDGVDIVGDVCNSNFISKLKKLKPKAIFCFNLLEHLKDRESFCSALLEILDSGTFIIASCPKNYPYHPDPIDTMFRPTVNELANEFISTTLVKGEIVNCGTMKQKLKYERNINITTWLFNKIKFIIRLFLPFYKFNDWLLLVSGEKRIDKNQILSATCVVLQKN